MTATISDEQVSQSLSKLEARRVETDVAFRSITEIEIAVRRDKTERLRAARIQLSLSKR